jgi:basic membrane protein A
MKHFLTTMFCLVLLTATLFGGGSPEKSTPKIDSNAVRIAMIVENTIDDKGWCQSMHDGILRAMEQLPGRIHYDYSEKMTLVNAGSAARQYVAQGYDIIIAHGAQYKNLTFEMAEEYPDVTFVVGTTNEIGPDNVFTYMPESEETGYLSGLIAAMTTRSGILGLVGPVDSGDAARYNRGFVLGARAVDPSITVKIAHSGSFSDFVRAGEIAQSQIRSGADLLTGSSQQALGALRTVADYPNEEIWWVGQEAAQLTIPEAYKVIGASSYNYSAVILALIDRFDRGITGGEVIPMNFNNGGFTFTFNPALKGMWEGAIEERIGQTIASFTEERGMIDYTSVDYSKL